MKRAFFIVSIVGFTLTLAFLSVAALTKSDCPIVPPPPKMHATKTAAGFNIDVNCPEGWVTHFSAEAVDAYNKSDKGYIASINFFAESTCVLKTN